MKEAIFTVVSALGFIFIAVCALGAGERYGVTMTFVAMLMWAMAVKEAEEWQKFLARVLRLLEKQPPPQSNTSQEQP